MPADCTISEIWTDSSPVWRTELHNLVKEPAEKQFYLDQAFAILKGIYDNYFVASGDSQAMISCGTVNYAKKKHVNVPIIYGDYFFTEALLKLKGLTSIF